MKSIREIKRSPSRISDCAICNSNTILTFEKYEDSQGYDHELWICDNCKESIATT